MNIHERINICSKTAERLKKIYPEGICSLNSSNPLELIISTRLSAQCTDARVNLVTPALFAAFPTLEAFCQADVDEIAELIKSCGLYKTKARDIKNMCIAIRDNFDGTVPDTMEALLSLPGVGRKTANLICGDVYGKDGYVVDTHMIRISQRMGLCSVKGGESNPALKIEMQLRKLIDESEASDFCHRIVLHGRALCTARKAKCEECDLNEICKKNIK